MSRPLDEIQTDMAVTNIAAQHCGTDCRQFPRPKPVDEFRKMPVDIRKLDVVKESGCTIHGKSWQIAVRQIAEHQFAQSADQGGVWPTTENRAIRFLRVEAAEENVENAAELVVVLVAGNAAA